MAWQDDIRKLDEDFAAGRIRAEEYRVRRDAILSSAAASGQQPAPPNPAESTQLIPPVTGEQPAPDRTQIVPQPNGGQYGAPNGGTNAETGAGANADRTQAVPGEAINQSGWQGQPSYEPGGWHQNIPGVPPQQGAPGMGGPRQPQTGGYPAQWGESTPGTDTAPPWSGPEFPPLAQPTGQDWLRQGPDAFRTSSSGGRRVLLIIGVIVLVAALGVGGFFLFSGPHRNTGGGGPSTTTTAPPTTTTPAGPPDLAIAPLPGTGHLDPSINDFNDVMRLGMLTGDEDKLYETAGASAARFAQVTLPNGVNILVLTVRTNSPGAAATALTNLDALERHYGMQPYTGTTPNGVRIDTINPLGTNPAAIRAHYSGAGTVVRVQVTGDAVADISKTFDQILAAQLQALPANG